jgi:signal transduction histidine kinase/ActR/RegA family two-component response regulator
VEYVSPTTHADRRRAPGRPVGQLLGAFALALVLPILVFVTILLWQFTQSERGRLEAEAMDAARSARIAVDRELAGLAAALETLALSPSLRQRDLEAFQRRAEEMRARLGIVAVLRDTTSQQLMNPRLPAGTPLPRSNLPEPDPAVWRSGRPVVSGVFTGAVAGEPLFAVQLPVPRPDAPDGPPDILSLSLPVERIRAVITERPLPEGWIIGVIDGAGRILARSAAHARFAGQAVTNDFPERATAPEGRWRGVSVDGTPVLTAYGRTALADWRVAVGIPLDVMTEPLRRSLRILLAVGAGLLLLAAVLAFAVGRRVERSLHALAERAAALGGGLVVPPLAAPVREVSAVGQAMTEASALLRARVEALRGFNASLEARVAERTRDLEAARERLLAEIAERESAEAQLRQAQKMEAVGRLTGGVAHDFNNLLTVILGNLSIVRRRLGAMADERVARAIDGAQEGGRRAAELTARLLAFSRQQPLAPAAVDANRLVAGMSDMLRRTLGEDVQIETVAAGGLWRALADPNQLENAILNLAVNARDAMPGGGKLTIETGNAWLDEAYAAARDEVRPGQYVMVCVSDTGTGMPPEVVARVFEPFFTTKPTGKGTGLGLSQVYGFVKQSGGHVAIYSEPGQGTTVKLYLPRLRDGAAAAAVPEQGGAAEPTAPPGRGETILVVEDDAMVREFAAGALEEAGYRVLAAGDGPEALALLEAHAVVALLFTDVVLTGPMNGKAVAEAGAARRPDLRVLFTTGYTRNAIIHHGRLDDGVALLGKPYSAAGLVRAVRQALDAPAAG